MTPEWAINVGTLGKSFAISSIESGAQNVNSQREAELAALESEIAGYAGKVMTSADLEALGELCGKLTSLGQGFDEERQQEMEDASQGWERTYNLLIDGLEDAA